MLLTACTIIRIEGGIGWVRLGSNANPEPPILNGIELVFRES
jgi:hypothetical protein